MGGSGSRYIPEPNLDQLRSLIDETLQRTESLSTESEINLELRNILSNFNTRDVNEVHSVLDQVKEICSELDFEKLLFGGSVAKHTYVDGVSDVDALVVMDSSENASPDKLLDMLHNKLKQLPFQLRKGTMAVTITTDSGLEIQLVPCYSSGDNFKISNESGSQWRDVNIKKFQSKLTEENKRLNRALVPCIKLVKALNDTLSEESQLSGYHIETLALKAVKRYDGPCTYKALTQHIVDKTSKLVLSPVKDPTGQSKEVDSNLGDANSVSRRMISQAFSDLGQSLASADTPSKWREIIKGD